MAKKVSGFVKLQIPAGKANPAPPVGTALGPQGINIMAFCKEFNARTQGQDTILPVEITIYEDRTFSFVLKTPPTPVRLREAAGLEKGSVTPRCPWYLPPRSLYDVSHTSSASMNSTCAQPSPA